MGHSAVSIVLIVHNTEPWLADCFDSLASQTLRDVELVVVDVASDRRTKRVLRRQLRRFDRVTKIVEKENVGGAAAGNAGILASTGEFVFLMDSDDVLPPRALEVLYAAAVDESLDVSMGRALAIVDGKVTHMRYRADMISWAKALTVSDLADRPELTMAPYYWGRLYRRQMLLDHDVWMRPGRLFADRYFTCKALRASRRTGVILDDTYFWRRDRGVGAAQRSITQRAGDGEALRARIDSFADVESLFREPDDEAILRYVRLSNLMRMFIHTPRLNDNPSLRADLAATALPYARSFDIDEVTACEFLHARHKVQWYLMVNERWDELADLQDTPEPASTPTPEGDQLEFAYASLIPDLPVALCRQFRFTIDRATANWTPEGELVVHVDVPNGMAIEPLHVTFLGRLRDGDIRVPVTDVAETETGLDFTVRVPPEIAAPWERRAKLAFETHGRYTTHEIESQRAS